MGPVAVADQVAEWINSEYVAGASGGRASSSAGRSPALGPRAGCGGRPAPTAATPNSDILENWHRYVLRLHRLDAATLAVCDDDHQPWPARVVTPVTSEAATDGGWRRSRRIHSRMRTYIPLRRQFTLLDGGDDRPRHRRGPVGSDQLLTFVTPPRAAHRSRRPSVGELGRRVAKMDIQTTASTCGTFGACLPDEI